MTAALLLASMLICVSACGKKQAQYYPTQEKFRKISTETTKYAKNPVYDDTYVEMKLTSESGAAVWYKYDSDMLSYVGEGGTFYVIGTDATKGFVHITVQDKSVGSYEEAKNAVSGSVTEITLESGRKAFYYTAANDGDNFHLVIDAKEILSSGKGVVHFYIGSKTSWTYGEDKIANVLDKGFEKAKKA